MIRRTFVLFALVCAAVVCAACSNARVDRPIVSASYNVHHDPSMTTAAVPDSPSANP